MQNTVIRIENSMDYEANTSKIVDFEFYRNGKVAPSVQIARDDVKDCDSQDQPKLKKDGTPKQTICNKKKGESSEVYSLEPEDMRRIHNYFVEKKKWLHLLIFVLSCNTARRISDVLSFTWGQLYNPTTGKVRSHIQGLKEQKTGKCSRPKINEVCKEVIQLYIEKTECDPTANNYTNSICVQMTGNFKGRKLEYSAYYKALKKAASELGIEYNIGTHSARKTYGAVSKAIHPTDGKSLEIIQTSLKHSSPQVTERYIGLRDKEVDQYTDDFGEAYDNIVKGNEEYKGLSSEPVTTMYTTDLTDLIKIAYEAGRNNADENDAMVHVNAITEIVNMIEAMRK